MDDNDRSFGTTADRAADEPRTRRRVIRAASGGLVAMLAAVGLAACGGDVTEDELEGDE